MFFFGISTAAAPLLLGGGKGNALRGGEGNIVRAIWIPSFVGFVWSLRFINAVGSCLDGAVIKSLWGHLGRLGSFSLCVLAIISSSGSFIMFLGLNFPCFTPREKEHFNLSGR